MSVESATNNDGTGVRYHDRKRYLWALSVVWVLTPLLGLYLSQVTGYVAFTWTAFVLWSLALPLLDLIFGKDTNNPPESAVADLESDRYYRSLLYLTVPMHFAVFVAGAWAVVNLSLGWFGYLGLALSVGLVNGIALNTGHELGHKKTKLERWLAKIVLAIPAYGHFFIEHNKGHHKDVATPEDSASARFGESIFRFAKREVPGNWRRAWKLEKDRLERQGNSVWSLDNEVLQPMLITLVLFGGIVSYFGTVTIPYLLIATAFSYWFLTSANYIEHYGLLRQKLPHGRYARVRPQDSWNANHFASNLILFHLQRHSDHHAYPTRRYQALRHFEDAPQLPSGYPGMYLVAVIPPLWRAVMDPRVLDLYNRDITKVNIDPKYREKILNRYTDTAPATE